MSLPAATLMLIAAAALGIAVPWAAIRMLTPALAQGPMAENYRGKRVFSGLGIAWLVWAGCAIIGGIVGAGSEGQGSLLPILTLAGPLALVCFALGLVDDSYGTGAQRGFRGHLSELKRGRLTTGGLKLIGISAASYVVALVLEQAGGQTAAAPIWALASGAAIALTANFVNLTDVRPGRALKAYVVLAALGVVSCVLGLGSLGAQDALGRAVDSAALAIFVAGPVISTWRLDLGERGMLGDAGANPAGAVAGMLIVSGLPWWGLLGYLVLMLGANLASERVSFSKVIAGNRVLSSIDRLGRRDLDS